MLSGLRKSSKVLASLSICLCIYSSIFYRSELTMPYFISYHWGFINTKHLKLNREEPSLYQDFLICKFFRAKWSSSESQNTKFRVLSDRLVSDRALPLEKLRPLYYLPKSTRTHYSKLLLDYTNNKIFLFLWWLSCFLCVESKVKIHIGIPIWNSTAYPLHLDLSPVPLIPECQKYS